MENILITGASTGIGQSLCKLYSDHGYRVFGSVRKEKDAERLSKDFGATFHPLIFDVSDHKAVENSVLEVNKVIGGEGLSCLINNAGIAVAGPVTLLSLEDFQKQFDVNLFGVIAVTKAYLPLLGAKMNYANKPGKIINISSVSGQIAFPFMSPYCASKFALEAFSESLRRELLLYGIDVILIEPGPIKTPIWEKSAHIPTGAKRSDFSSSLTKFQQHVVKSAKHGIEAQDLSQRIYKVFLTSKPKTRYVFTNKKFINYTIPRYLVSSRRFDSVIRKMFFS